MAINGKHSIFRVSSSGQTETTVATDKIEFDDNNIVPDARSHIISIRPIHQVVNTDNPNPGSQNLPNSQDTGNAPIIVEIKGYFDENAGVAGAILKLREWVTGKKVVKTTFPKGRFGFRSDDRTEWNAVPITTGGYHLVHFELEDVVEFNIIPFVIRLKFVGSPTLFPS